MTQNTGMKVPAVTFKTRVRDETVEGPNPFRWQDVTSDEIFSGRKVIVFCLARSVHTDLFQHSPAGI